MKVTLKTSVPHEQTINVKKGTILKIATWNVNHRAVCKTIPSTIAPAIISTDADILVFTEFVHSDTKEDRKAFYDQLVDAGYTNQILSSLTAKQNHILIASRTPIVQGDLKAPATIHRAVASNFLHVKCLENSAEIIGIRVPDYSKTKFKEIAQDYWRWFSSFAHEIAGRSIIMTGDFNIDLEKKRYKFRHHLTDLLENGWQIASPKERASYYANRNNAPHRLDHTFLTEGFEVIDSSYVQQVGSLWKCGENKYKEPDHSILVVEVARTALSVANGLNSIQASHISKIDINEMRVCRICLEKKPLDEEHFPLASKRKSGKPAFRTECIICRRQKAKEYRKEYYQKNKASVLIQNSDYVAQNEEKIKAYQASYRAKHKAEKSRTTKKSNREIVDLDVSDIGMHCTVKKCSPEQNNDFWKRMTSGYRRENTPARMRVMFQRLLDYKPTTVIQIRKEMCIALEVEKVPSRFFRKGLARMVECELIEWDGELNGGIIWK